MRDIAWKRPALALALGLVCGIVAARIGLPLPWMLGPMIGTTIAALLGAPIAGPDRLRPIMVPVLGVMLGSGITSEVLDAARQWALSFALLPLFLLVAASASYTVYRRIGRYDPVTAFFSAMPGGLNEMLILGAEKGGNERHIAMAHAGRVLIVISFVGLFFGLVMGVSTGGQTGRPWIGLDALTLRDFAVLGACAVIGVPLGSRLRLPASPVMGPMILSGIAHATHMVEVPPPTLLVIGAQVVVGTVIGCRFLGATAREIGRDLWLACLSSGVMLIVALGFSELLALMTGIDLSQAFLAYSPGGLMEMSLLALAMGQDLAYVSVTHLVRIMMVVAAAPLAFRLSRPGSRR